MANKRRGAKPRGKGNNYKDRDRLTDTGGLSKADREMESDSRDRRDCFRSKHNAPEWYAQNPQLMKDYASFPYGVPLGTSIPQGMTAGYPGNTYTAIPGVIALEFAPAIGIANQETDPINIAMRNIYSFVRHANSGSTNYEAPDLMMYLVAMDSVYMMHAFMKRALGVLLDYTPLNRYYPQSLLNAMHLDADDFMEHQADFRGFINQYAVKMGSMCVPNSMSYMARHSWMCEGIYTDDGGTGKAQTYLYTPTYFYKFSEGTPDTAQLGTVALTSVADPVGSNITVKQLTQLATSLLEPIITNESMNIMSGDILKAFGADGVVKVTGVLDGYMVLPLYSQEVLSQIENATILGSESYASTIKQATAIGTGYLIASYSTNVRVFPNTYTGTTPLALASQIFRPLTGPQFLNFHHSMPAPEEAMVATRLKCTVTGTSTAHNATPTEPYQSVTLNSCGSELVLQAYIYRYAGSTSAMTLNKTLVQTLMHYHFDASTPIEAIDVSAFPLLMAALSIFDWHPFVFHSSAISTSASTPVGSPLPFGDIANYTVLSPENIANLHATALLSEFSVPQMGSFAKSI